MGVLVDETTRVSVQGLSDETREVIEQMVAYGTAVVAAVSAGHYGERVAGVPVYDSVADAVLFHQPTATLITVPPPAVLDACLDALQHGIRLLLIATDGIPYDDAARLLRWATDNGARVIGPNSAGLINPAHRVKIGAIGGAKPDRTFPAGRVGIISRADGMTAELGRVLRHLDLGVTTAISLGSDTLFATTPADLLPLFERDPETDGVVLITEPNLDAEKEIATLIREQRYTKPLITAPMGGLFSGTFSGTSFVHPIAPGEDAPEPYAALEAAGALVATDLADLIQYLHLTFHGTPYLGPDIDELW